MSLRIRDAALAVGLSADTLRFYEKIRLLPPAARGAGGHRAYGGKDIARLRFVRRAQGLGFTLAEIRQLLRFRENPARCSQNVRRLAQRKCESLAATREVVEMMHRELALLLDLCAGQGDHCPIIEHLESGDRAAARG